MQYMYKLTHNVNFTNVHTNDFHFLLHIFSLLILFVHTKGNVALVYIQESVLSLENHKLYIPLLHTSGGVPIAIQSNLLSTLKGTPNLYFLSEVHISTG